MALLKYIFDFARALLESVLPLTWIKINGL